MGYDYVGLFSVDIGYQVNLFFNFNSLKFIFFSIDVVVKVYFDGGVQVSKFVFGMFMYGCGFIGIKGFGSFFSGIGQGDWEVGIWDYKLLFKFGVKVEFDSIVYVMYSWDFSIEEFIIYDIFDMVIEKVSYFKSYGFGGSLFWEVLGD